MTLFIQGHEVWLPALVLLGIVVGFVAGLFGVGGGFLLTPMLNVIFGIPLPIAVGTGLCLMVGTAVPALLRHRTMRQGELRVDLLMLIGSFLGVHAGTSILGWLESLGAWPIGGHAIAVAPLVVQAGYILLLVTSAAAFWGRWRRLERSTDGVDPLMQSRRGPLAGWSRPWPVDLPAVSLGGVSALSFAYLGLGMGVLSGLLGIGGGIALMPILVFGFGFPLPQAAGTGILALVASASVGTFLHALRGHVDLRLAAALLIGASLSAQVGALATRSIATRTLRRLLSAVLLASAAAVTWNVFRRL